MFHHDERTDEHPEAVRSEPVPVPPPSDEVDGDRIPHQVDAEHAADNRTYDAAVDDRDGDGVPDAYDDDPDAVRDADVADGHEPADVTTDRDGDGVPDARDDSAPSVFGGDATVDADRDGDGVRDADADRDGDGVPDAVDRDDDTTPSAFGTDADADADVNRDGDRDGDGIPDALDPDDDTDHDADGVPDDTDAAYAERSGNPDPDAALEDRGTFDDPVVASPVEVDDDRTTDGATYAEPATFGAVAMGAATVGGAAALATDRDRDPADRDRDPADRDPDAYDPDVAATDSDDSIVQDATELKPGDVEAEPVVTLMSADAAQGFRDRWRDVQLRFVDDPRAAAGEAQSLAEEAVDAMVSALTNHKNELGSWQSAEAGDTEQLRVVVRRYRDLIDRLLGE